LIAKKKKKKNDAARGHLQSRFRYAMRLERSIGVYTLQLVVQPVVQPVAQPVVQPVAKCKRTLKSTDVKIR